MKYNSLIVLFSLMLIVACSGKKDNKKEAIKEAVIDYQIELGEVSPKSVFDNDTMSIWGGSLVKGQDNLYHMFYSIWPKNIGWEWVNYSIISHAVSESPFGPFKHKDDVLPDRGVEFWDGSATHNPTVHNFNGKYYLYYMGNFGDEKIVSVPGKAKINWVHRNNQRIGVAVADSPNGPWKRFDKPVLDITENDSLAHDALMTSNPSVCQMADGKILMVYKAVGKKFKLPAGGPVVHMVAIADSPTGPFKKYPDPVFTFEGERFPAEDPYIWYQDGKYRAIVKRIKHEGKKRVFSLVHYDSEDGINWNQAKHFEISDRTVTFTDGRKIKFDHLERPQVFIENGEPVALLCAADSIDVNNVRQSFNIQIPLKITKHKN
ncbi:MAG: glycoside hydrolase family protein [Jejuia sp.]